MSLLSGTNQTIARVTHRGRAAAYFDLTKARLSSLVLITTAVGFLLATPAGVSVVWATFVWTMLGTALAAASAAAFNQVVEAPRDAMMLRTRGRPLVVGTFGMTHGLLFAVGCGVGGVVILAVFATTWAALLALATVVIYVAAYTPLKPLTTVNTLVGAVCGALPPLIGWSAATGALVGGAWILAAILFVWQIPHFFALAWMYRDDYERGGFLMLPVVDRAGTITGRVVTITCLALIPLTLTTSLWGLTGRLYAVGAVLLGTLLVVLGVAFHRAPNDTTGRRLFLATILYLPVLLCLMVANKQ